MKTTKPIEEKQFNAVQYMRQERDALSGKLATMTKAEIMEYFRKRSPKTTVKPCA